MARSLVRETSRAPCPYTTSGNGNRPGEPGLLVVACEEPYLSFRCLLMCRLPDRDFFSTPAADVLADTVVVFAAFGSIFFSAAMVPLLVLAPSWALTMGASSRRLPGDAVPPVTEGGVSFATPVV